MTTLSLETSKKVYELCGEYETEMVWIREGGEGGLWRIGFWREIPENRMVAKYIEWKWCSAPNFAELIRLLPKIAKAVKHKMYSRNTAEKMARLYHDAPTEPEGMAAVESYLIENR